MEIKTFRASNLQEALARVRQELGPEAAVLHTREVRAAGLRRFFPGQREIEVTASHGIHVPSRLAARRSVELPAETPVAGLALDEPPAMLDRAVPSAPEPGPIENQLRELRSMVDDLCRKVQPGGGLDLPEEFFHLYTELIDAELPDDAARSLVQQARAAATPEELQQPRQLFARVERLVAAKIPVSGALDLTPGQRRIVALVGPTGVGKTTTIAKLAANFRLREKRRVGLITVDTYRIAAVEQLRTYADIIDLPMHVVSTPREMRLAVEQLADMDLVLMDTAGRSPRDEVKLQELRAFLGEAQADDVLLVHSAVSSSSALSRTSQRFADVGTTGLILTKLDEATGLGSLLPALEQGNLPLAYVTDGQNVPDDIEPAEATRIAQRILGRADERRR